MLVSVSRNRNFSCELGKIIARKKNDHYNRSIAAGNTPKFWSYQ